MWRSTELRVEQIELDDRARQFIKDAAKGTIRIIANRRDKGDADEYESKNTRSVPVITSPPANRFLFFEVTPGDASEFAGTLSIRGETVDGYRILRTESPAVPNAIAAFLLYLRDEMGKLPHVYFGWSEGNPISYLLKYIAFGEGILPRSLTRCYARQKRILIDVRLCTLAGDYELWWVEGLNYASADDWLIPDQAFAATSAFGDPRKHERQ